MTLQQAMAAVLGEESGEVSVAEYELLLRVALPALAITTKNEYIQHSDQRTQVNLC